MSEKFGACMNRNSLTLSVNNGVIIMSWYSPADWKRLTAIPEAHIRKSYHQFVCTAERSIVRRAAVLTTELEVLEVRFAKAGEASSLDLETYQRCANSLRRLLEAVGLQRRSRDLNPKLDDLLLEHAQRAAAAVHTDEAEVIDG